MAEEEQQKKDEQKYPGGSPVMALGIYGLVGYMLLMTVLIFVALVVLWPPIRSEGKAEAQRILEGGAPKGNQNQAAGAANQTPAPPAGQGAAPTPGTTPAQGATPAAGAPAQGATAAPGATATPATPRATPHPALVAMMNEPDEHKRIFNGQCIDMNGDPRAGVAPLKVPFVTSLRLSITTPRCVYDEDRLLLIVLFAGALGGIVYALRSLVWYIGNRSLKWSWSALYFLSPFASAAIALIFYFVVRGGFFSPTSSVSDTSPFGFAALAALIGMFTEQAINKLRSVAETLLAGKEQGKDHVGPAPVVTSVSPPSGLTKGGEPVSIVGDNFRPGVTVTFGGGAATVESIEAKLIKVKTPPHAAGKVDVVVANDDKQQHVSKDSFEYKDEPPPPPPAPTTAQPNPATGEPAPPATGEAASTPPPTISGVNPDVGNIGGGEQVTIRGANFVTGATVTFDGLPADDVVVADSSTINLKTPLAQTEGIVEVVVSNPGGGSSSPATFTYTAGG